MNNEESWPFCSSSFIISNMGAQLGKLLIIFGVVLVIVGGLFLLGAKLPWLRLGRLPGDIIWERGSVRIYFPLVTSILLSLLLTLIFWLLRR
jgi:hypothetical protein